jgi:signal transduction histidine kinase/ligand-binding sensor domain-containing protein
VIPALVLSVLLPTATALAERNPGAASPPSYSRSVWQGPDGLPEDFAQALAQTRDGYLWIGTSGGLVRFDGVHFVTFNRGNEPAIRDDSIYSLSTSSDGALWAGTEGGGLIRYEDGAFRSFGPAEGLTNAFVRVVFEDRERRLWIGTDGGLFRMRDETLLRIDDRGDVPEMMNVHSICQDREGRLLVGGWGLLVLDGEHATHYTSKENLADNSIRTVRQTADGAVWIGTISGLRRLEGGVRGDPFTTPRLIDGVNACVLHEGRRGQLWIGTYGRGLMRLSDGQLLKLRAPSPLPHDNVLAILEDAEENVWVGTQGGLLRLSPGAASTVTTTDGAPLSINTIYEDPRGGLFVTALNGRLFRLVRQTLVPVDLPGGLGQSPIRNVFRDSKGRLWIGTDGRGVARQDGSEVQRYTMKEGLVNDFVRAFCEDGEGGIWIGTDGGLSHWRSGTFRNYTIAQGLPYPSIRGLLLDRGGTLWVATEGGLIQYREGAFRPEPSLERLRGQKVWALHEDSVAGLWIGTQGDGLFLFKDRRLLRFTTDDGLPSNKIYFIAEDPRGHLWLTGPNGVASVSRSDLEALHDHAPRQVAVRLYGTAEGLSTNQMNGGVQPAGALTSAGELWLPSTKGAVRITPDTPDHGSAPPVLIEQVIADHKPVPLSTDLRLPPGEGNLEIHYTSIRLGSPERMRFKYWMEGFDHDWTTAGQRRVAYYTNLPPSRYRFHVAAYEMNAPGNATESTLSFEWRPHFYQTRWFLAICATIAIAAAWGGYRIHVRSIRRQFAAVLEERNRLAREMHDTLIQGCIGVSTLLEAASQAQDVSPRLSHDLLDRARTEVRSTVDEARLAVWNLRHSSGDGATLVSAVAQLARRLGAETGINVEVETSGAPLPIGAETERSLMMLIREALQNAIRHAAPKRLSVALRFEGRCLRVEIEDDGRGFDSSSGSGEGTHHYGLIGMQERVEKLGGRFHLTSSSGNGTRVRLEIPLSSVPRFRRSAAPSGGTVVQ